MKWYFYLMEKQIITDIFLTKESFIKYSNDLREKKAKEYGMTLEEWDNAILKQNVVMPVSGSNI